MFTCTAANAADAQQAVVALQNPTTVSKLSANSGTTIVANQPSSAQPPASDTPGSSIQSSSSPAPAVNTGAVIGGVIGAVAFVAIVVIAAFVALRRSRNPLSSSYAEASTDYSAPIGASASAVLSKDADSSAAPVDASAVEVGTTENPV